MYAVIRSGGKQYRVSPGGSVRLEKLPGEVGASVTLDEVLMLGSEESDEKGEGAVIGAPVVEGARVTGTITAQGRGPKLTVFKMKRRKGYRRKHGHRQDYTEIRVDQIEGR
ncbi:MAG TPA: 50S ribosomal protein L21 [Myxococcota bacterium]|nr:50S ribosomal protein L21 [Myxococcota bacterium]